MTRAKPRAPDTVVQGVVEELRNQSRLLNEALSALVAGSDNQARILNDRLNELIAGVDNQTRLVDEGLKALIAGSSNQTRLLDEGLKALIAGSDNQARILNEGLSGLFAGSDNQTRVLNERLRELIAGSDNLARLLNDKLSELVAISGGSAGAARDKSQSNNGGDGGADTVQYDPSLDLLAGDGSGTSNWTGGQTDRRLTAVLPTHNRPVECEENSPLISLVLLCYNHEKFVAEALDGVLAQTYSPLDIVIIDDCSQDRTADIVAAKLANLRDRSNIRFIRNPQNLGLLRARELGIVAARGAFIVDTCDDDVMLPDMVAEMVEAWRTKAVSLVTTNQEYIDEYSRPLGRTFRDCNLPADDSFETLARDGANACCNGASMGFEREVYETFGMPPAHLENRDIMVPFYAYLLKGAHFIRKPLLKYRVHGKNASLSLIAERSDELGKARIHERIFYGHLAHAVVMDEVLDRLSATMPARYTELAPTIGPLIKIQMTEMARKLIRARGELRQLGTSSGAIGQ